MPLSLAALPEELLLRILALALHPPRPTADLAPHPPRNRTAPLLVSRRFFRIAYPLLYHTLHLHSPHQAARALDALSCRPARASYVRRIVFGGIWHGCAGVLALCDYLQDVDICLDAGRTHPTPGLGGDVDAEAFCRALDSRHTITHLTLRKDPAVYLSHPRPVHVLQRLAQTVPHWAHLESVHFALRMSASPSAMPLARVLSAAPRLHSVRAQLPAVWNTFLLVIATNPRLERVMLYAEPIPGPQCKLNLAAASAAGTKGSESTEHAVLGSALYMMEAKKHARLSELVKAGTSIVRTRAHTTIATVSASPGGAPLGAVRAKEVADELMANRDGLGATATQPFSVARHAHAQDV